MRYASGSILTDEGFVQGYIGFDSGGVVEVQEGIKRNSEWNGIIVPTFINAHTHLADFVVPIDLSMSLKEIVAPPHGLKHRVLSQTPRNDQKRAIGRLKRFMFRRGISTFIDFREGGVEGSKLISTKSGKPPKPFIMGRPNELNFNEDEVSAILAVADGIAISGIKDWKYRDLESLSEFTRNNGRKFALHASERAREDIESILALEPSFLVHMTSATNSDMRRCADEQVPIVVCPRSNLFFGLAPPLAKMIDAGVEVSLGTDNAMTAMPDILSEMEFAGRILRRQGVKELECVVRMAIHNGRKILNETQTISMKTGSPCDFAIIRSKGADPVVDLVLRSASEDPLLVCSGGEELRGRRT